MDIVDKSKEIETDVFIGNDNEHDVLNTQLAVLNRLLEVLRRGSLSREFYQLDGNVSCEPFTERFENYLAGWTATFDVLIPNTMTACDGLVTTVACANGTVTITDDAGNTLYTLSVLSGGTLTQEIQDSTATITDSSGTTLHTLLINAEGSASQAIADSVVTLRDTALNTIGVVNVLAEGVTTETVGDSSVANSDTSYSVSVLAEGSLVLPDSTVNVNSVNEGIVVSVKAIDINVTDGASPVTPDAVSVVGNTVTIQVPSGSGLDPDAEAFITAASITDGNQQIAVNTLVLQLKNYGIWTKLKSIFPFIGGSATQHRWDLIRLTQGTFYGGMSHTSAGIVPNASNSYFDTGFADSDFTSNTNYSFGIYTPSTASGLYDIGCQVSDASKRNLIIVNNGGNCFYSAFTNGFGSDAGSGNGFHVIDYNSIAPTSYLHYRNGSVVAGSLQSSLTASGLDFFLCATNENGIVKPGSYGNKTISFAYFGDDLTSGEIKNLYNSVQTFQTALSRNV
jgi:hypothetical protein